MKLDFTGSRWFILFITIVLPILLLTIAISLHAGICYIMLLLVWMGAALMFLYLPNFKD